MRVRPDRAIPPIPAYTRLLNPYSRGSPFRGPSSTLHGRRRRARARQAREPCAAIVRGAPRGCHVTRNTVHFGSSERLPITAPDIAFHAASVGGSPLPTFGGPPSSPSDGTSSPPRLPPPPDSAIQQHTFVLSLYQVRSPAARSILSPSERWYHPLGWQGGCGGSTAEPQPGTASPTAW